MGQTQESARSVRSWKGTITLHQVVSKIGAIRSRADFVMMDFTLKVAIPSKGLVRSAPTTRKGHTSTRTAVTTVCAGWRVARTTTLTAVRGT